MTQQLSERILKLLTSMCAFRVVTTDQVTRYLYVTKAANPDHATLQVLSRLATKDFISRGYLYAGMRPKSVWYVTRKNLGAIKSELEKTRRANLYEIHFADAEYDQRSSAKLQQNTLGHEVGISEFFLSLTQSVEQSHLTMPVWLNTSPSHPLLSTKVQLTLSSKTTGKETTKTLPVNPDGFFVLDDGNEQTFYFLEFDNNTETLVQKITNKFIAYHAYNKQKLFKRDALDNIVQTYNLPIRDGARIGVRVLFVTTTENRRNDLFIKSTAMPAGDLFLFATIDDVRRDPFGSYWLGKSLFAPYLEDYWNMAKPKNKNTPKARPSALRAFRTESIRGMEKIAIP